MGIIKGIFGHKETGSVTEQPDLNIIFNEYYDRLVYFSLQLVKDKEQAEDIAQEAFIKYWDQHQNVAPHPIAIKNFLYSTVRNASLNVIRHNKVVEGYIELHGNAEPEEPPVIEAIITAEAVAEIHAALQTLPESHRIISIMGYFEGKKNQEIADELGMSVNTVKKQKQRALELMRMQLSPEVFALLVAAGFSFLNR
ncbi:RNA polymerase sigma-70 factor [Mucilaginibacter celer]|uniref:RNA polymerase sigma-70 factor n=1 Tax=Mucilaginibacter celer TaxID=2305508 RepID=A0A494VX63_9SPHI|nr:RNA polymerase sigma-70 factor [Mucilaginibacter celer]AYL95582.1 RNA polymerase sigma-70 factor [Mucilaginibacter celer]